MPYKQHSFRNFASSSSKKSGLDVTLLQGDLFDWPESREETTAVFFSGKDEDFAGRMVPYVFHDVFMDIL